MAASIPKHVRVEAYHGESDNGTIRNPIVTVLNEANRADNNGSYIYQGAIPASESGAYGFSVRVVPRIRISCKRMSCG